MSNGFILIKHIQTDGCILTLQQWKLSITNLHKCPEPPPPPSLVHKTSSQSLMGRSIQSCVFFRWGLEEALACFAERCRHWFLGNAWAESKDLSMDVLAFFFGLQSPPLKCSLSLGRTFPLLLFPEELCLWPNKVADWILGKLALQLRHILRSFLKLLLPSDTYIKKWHKKSGRQKSKSRIFLISYTLIIWNTKFSAWYNLHSFNSSTFPIRKVLLSSPSLYKWENWNTGQRSNSSTVTKWSVDGVWV